jgi:hypothetical protein
MYNAYKCDAGEIVYRRNPTPAEIRFGHGAIHYRTFTLDDTPEIFRADGTKKSRFKALDDGLFYSR